METTQNNGLGPVQHPKDSEFSHFTFPISLLKGAFESISVTCEKIITYCGFKIAQKLENDEEIDAFISAGDYMGTPWAKPLESFEFARNLNESTTGKTPMTSISREVILNFYHEDKTEFEIACFLAFCGIKSIIGKKRYVKTNKALVFARMFGYRSAKDTPEILEGLQAKYAFRWHRDKVLTALELDWGLKRYSGTGSKKTGSGNAYGMYLAFNKITLEELITIAESNKKKYREKVLAESKKELRGQVLRDLNKQLPDRRKSDNKKPNSSLNKGWNSSLNKRRNSSLNKGWNSSLNKMDVPLDLAILRARVDTKNNNK